MYPLTESFSLWPIRIERRIWTHPSPLGALGARGPRERTEMCLPLGFHHFSSRVQIKLLFKNSHSDFLPSIHSQSRKYPDRRDRITDPASCQANVMCPRTRFLLHSWQ